MQDFPEIQLMLENATTCQQNGEIDNYALFSVLGASHLLRHIILNKNFALATFKIGENKNISPQIKEYLTEFLAPLTSEQKILGALLWPHQTYREDKDK
jgi:hypothetical protein